MKPVLHPVDVTILGERHVGRYKLAGNVVTVYHRGGAREAQLNGASAEFVAKTLLPELVNEWRRILAERDALGPPFSFEEWLTLTDEQRRVVQRSWNPYIGHNIHIPREAAKLLMTQSDLPIVRVGVGIYHGGIYILTPDLWNKDFHRAPAWLTETFLGFPVGYCEHDPDIEWSDDD